MFKFMYRKQIKKIITHSFLSILGFTFTVYFVPVTAEDNKVKLNLEYLQKIPKDDYILGKGDVLDIKFVSMNTLIDDKAGNDLMDLFANFNSYEIDGEGKIYLPKLEDIYVEYLTIYELKELLSQAYKKILKRPEIKIRIKEYRTVQVFIDGEVENPGLYSVPGRTNFKNLANRAINQDLDRRQSDDFERISSNSGKGTFPDLHSIIKLSGGITPYSDLSNIQVVRNNPISKGGGKIKTNINFLKVIESGDTTNNIRIMDGDRILLKRTETNIAKQINKAIRTNLNPLFISVTIKGRVEEAGNYFVNRSSSLNDAIQVAGNLKVLKGNIKLTSFLADGGIETKNIRYNANAKRGDSNNPYLKNGDIINVQKGAIIKTNEVIKEVTDPFLGIFSTYAVIDAIFD